MSLTEAEELLSFIQIDHVPGRVVLRRLGNGREWVLLIKTKVGHYFIWSVGDWLRYRQCEEDGVLPHEQPCQCVIV